MGAVPSARSAGSRFFIDKGIFRFFAENATQLQ